MSKSTFIFQMVLLQNYIWEADLDQKACEGAAKPNEFDYIYVTQKAFNGLSNSWKLLRLD